MWKLSSCYFCARKSTSSLSCSTIEERFEKIGIVVPVFPALAKNLTVSWKISILGISFVELLISYIVKLLSVRSKRPVFKGDGLYYCFNFANLSL